MAETGYQVLSHPEGGWAVKKRGSLRATKRFRTKEEALDWAREKAVLRRSDLVIFRKNGTVQEKIHG